MAGFQDFRQPGSFALFVGSDRHHRFGIVDAGSVPGWSNLHCGNPVRNGIDLGNVLQFGSKLR